jgi:RecA/RadA recombinase
MSRLIGKFRDVIGKEKLGQECSNVLPIPTGFDVFDYRNGKIDVETNEISAGLDQGKIIYVVGKSGTAKTTWCIQMAANIVDQYEDSFATLVDFERATSKIRLKNITKFNDEKLDEKIVHLDSNINSESVFKLIKEQAKMKLDKEVFEATKIDTGLTDRNGKTIYICPPTIVIVDSLAVMAPKDITEEEKMSGSMSASAIAKVNTQIFKRIMGDLRDANIILMVVNHINAKIEINMFAKTQAQVNFLKQDETLPGKCVAAWKHSNVA